jgi:hypothetical protein
VIETQDPEDDDRAGGGRRADRGRLRDRLAGERQESQRQGDSERLDDE